MNTTLFVAIALLLALIFAVLLSRLPKATWHLVSVTTIWAFGLIFIFALGILWLGTLGLAIFVTYRARAGAYGEVDAGALVTIWILFALVLLALGVLLVALVNRFYDWWLKTRVNALADSYQSKVSLEFSETFKRQLRDSHTFQRTVFEAKKLAEEMVAFSAVSHTTEEWDAFREAWHAKTERFAERVAQGDLLAVEVILKAIEKESEKEREGTLSSAAIRLEHFEIPATPFESAQKQKSSWVRRVLRLTRRGLDVSSEFIAKALIAGGEKLDRFYKALGRLLLFVLIAVGLLWLLKWLWLHLPV